MGTRRAESDVGIAYGEDPDKATAVILNALNAVEGAFQNPGRAVAF